MNIFFKDNGRFRWTVIVPLAIAAIIVSLVVADFLYGDWKCAFAECRIVK